MKNNSNKWEQNAADKKVNNDKPNLFYDHKQDQEEESKKPILFRLLAFLTFLAFLGFVFLTTWPGLTLPSLDLLSQSEKLSKNPPVNRLKQYVVKINVISRPGKVIAVQKSGTGFNISSNGIIVTNRHVLSDAVSITVTFSDGKTYQAKSYKSSLDMDLVLIYLEAKGLPAATLNMEKAKVGDRVMIIGNPLGIGNVVVEGTVSAYLKVSGCPVPVFVIDAPIHPGNSGSPVFNENRQVAGVIFGSICQTGDSAQQGVAIPSEYLLNSRFGSLIPVGDHDVKGTGYSDYAAR